MSRPNTTGCQAAGTTRHSVFTVCFWGNGNLVAVEEILSIKLANSRCYRLISTVVRPLSRPSGDSSSGMVLIKVSSNVQKTAMPRQANHRAEARGRHSSANEWFKSWVSTSGTGNPVLESGGTRVRKMSNKKEPILIASIGTRERPPEVRKALDKAG